MSNDFSLRLSLLTYISETPLLQGLRSQVLQGAMTQPQGCLRFARTLVPPHHIQVPSDQDFLQQTGNQCRDGPLQLVVQLQDASHARQLSLLLPQDQQQYNGSDFASRMGQNLNHSGMGHPQGQASLQQNFVQNSLSVPPTDMRFSSTPSTSQAHPPPGQQVPVPSTNFTDLSLPELRSLYAQMIRTWMEEEKGLQASSTCGGGEGDIQRRQQLRLKLNAYRQRVFELQEFMNTKARAR